MSAVYSIKDGFANMNFEKVQKMLADSYWVPNIGIDEVIKSAGNSALLVGAFSNDGDQIGYARVISDKSRFAYILDVIVDENFRKIGIGQAMMKYILNHDELRDAYQFLLITKDAHELYRKVGFEVVKRPNDWMEIKHERPKR